MGMEKGLRHAQPDGCFMLKSDWNFYELAPFSEIVRMHNIYKELNLLDMGGGYRALYKKYKKKYKNLIKYNDY